MINRVGCEKGRVHGASEKSPSTLRSSIEDREVLLSSCDPGGVQQAWEFCGYSPASGRHVSSIVVGAAGRP